MTLMYIGFGIMTVAAVVAIINSRRLLKALKKANREIKSQSKFINSVIDDRFDYIVSSLQKAEVREKTGMLVPCFEVFRTGAPKGYVISRYFYDPNDSDDRDYKRIHAEEVAEKLNEKP